MLEWKIEPTKNCSAICTTARNSTRFDEIDETIITFVIASIFEMERFSLVFVVRLTDFTNPMIRDGKEQEKNHHGIEFKLQLVR